MIKIRDLLAIVVIHEPERRIDVAGRAGDIHDTPVCLIQIIPGKSLAAVDLFSKLLAILGRSRIDQSTIVSNLRSIFLRCICFAIPVSRIGGIVGQTVAGSSQDDIALIRIQCISSARQPAYIDCASSESFTRCFIRSTDRDIDRTDVVALACHFINDQLVQASSTGDDDISVLGRYELECELVDVLGSRFSRCCLGLRTIISGSSCSCGSCVFRCSRRCFGG